MFWWELRNAISISLFGRLLMTTTVTIMDEDDIAASIEQPDDVADVNGMTAMVTSAAPLCDGEDTSNVGEDEDDEDEDNEGKTTAEVSIELWNGREGNARLWQTLLDIVDLW